MFKAAEFISFALRTKPAPVSRIMSACHPSWFIAIGLPAAKVSKNLFAELFQSSLRSMTNDVAKSAADSQAAISYFGATGIMKKFLFSTPSSSATARTLLSSLPVPITANRIS